MEYRILDEDGKIVAWIDTNSDEQLVRKGYILESAEHLKGMDCDGELTPIIDLSTII